MTEYYFRINGGHLTALCDDDGIYIAGNWSQRDNKIVINNGSETLEDGLYRYEPSDKFWAYIADVTFYIPQLIRQHREISLPKEAVPDVTEWGRYHFRHVPKYESRVLEYVQNTIFWDIKDGENPYKKNPRLARLVETAFEEVDDDTLPPRLRNRVQTTRMPGYVLPKEEKFMEPY